PHHRRPALRGDRRQSRRTHPPAPGTPREGTHLSRAPLPHGPPQQHRTPPPANCFVAEMVACFGSEKHGDAADVSLKSRVATTSPVRRTVGASPVSHGFIAVA